MNGLDALAALRLVEFHELVADKAKALMRTGVEKGWQLRPMDAIHLGTAQPMSATVCYTYDDRLDKFAPLIGCPVQRPEAAQPYLLP